MTEMQKTHVQRLQHIRQEAINKGMKLLSEDEILQPCQQCAELLEVLEWYEAKISLVNRHDFEGDAARDALAKDYGQKARAAIAKARGQ
jgi:hypothetical protein